MAYYVRLVEKIAYIEIARACLEFNSFACIEADIPTKEFKTTNNTLSIWKIENLDSLSDAVCSIQALRNEIKNVYFILMPSDEVETSFTIDRTSPTINGKSPVLQGACEHYDITNVTFMRIIHLIRLLAKLAKEDEASEKYIVPYTGTELEALMHQYHAEGKLDLAVVNKRLKQELHW